MIGFDVIAADCPWNYSDKQIEYGLEGLKFIES